MQRKCWLAVSIDTVICRAFSINLLFKDANMINLKHWVPYLLIIYSLSIHQRTRVVQNLQFDLQQVQVQFYVEIMEHMQRNMYHKILSSI